MQKTVKLAYNVLIGINGVLLLFGVYGIIPFIGILAILYAVSKLVPTTTK